MTLVNKSKQAMVSVINDIAKKENIPYDKAYLLFNALSQKKRRKLLETVNKRG